MIQSWPGQRGEYTGTTISNNTIDCGPNYRCGFGLLVGGDPWYQVNTYGGSIHDNTIKNAKEGLVIDDAHDVEIYNNPVINPLDKAYSIGTRSKNIDTSKETMGASYASVNWDGKEWSVGGICRIDCSASANDAKFIRQNVPTIMTAGETYSVSVTMENNGASTWTESGKYRLGSQNPQDNGSWGINRIVLNNQDHIEPIDNNQKTFTFIVTAPSTPGTYNFQWQMVQDGVEWFGEKLLISQLK